MEYSSISTFSVVVACVATLALIGNWLLWRQLVLLDKELEKNASSIEKEGQITYLSHMSTDRKLQMFEQRLRQIADDAMAVRQAPAASAQVAEIPTPASIEPAQPDSPVSINNASNLFNEGVETDEVARRCGLSKAEAELMALVQEKGKLAS